MQNFTLRFKGKMFYLLTLTLLIGSLSSVYGQSCPTVDEPAQSFCDALSTIADLDANGTNIQWYAEEDSTNPLPMNELLENDEDYFADSPDCTDPGFTRPSVTVTITAPEIPEVQDDFFTPCSGGGPYDIEDLKEAIDAEPAPSGYTLGIFPSRYGQDDEPFEDDDPLSTGNYFVGYYNDTCQTQRKPVRFEPVVANAPTAASPQTVCEGTTVSELSAQGENLWYRTATSQPALSDDFEVEDGETYYASRIVPADGPPCESEGRTAVTVNVIAADAGPDSTDNVLCVSEADSQLNTVENARDYFLSLLSNNNDSDPDNDVPTDGTFSDESLAQIVADYTDGTKVDTYSTTYTATFAGDCEDTVDLAVRVEEDPNAGEDTEETVCVSDFESFLPLDPALIPVAENAIFDYIEGTDITPGGTFSPSISDLFDQINDDFNSDNFPATYTVTYTVDNSGCTDSSELTLNVQSSNDAGEDNDATLCVTDVAEIFASEAALRDYYINLLGAEDTEGSFSPSLSTLIDNYEDGIDGDSEVFETTYTVDESSECDPSSATATLTINDSEPAEAGDIDSQVFCSNDEPVDLNDYLGPDSMIGGTFSIDGSTIDDTFDPSDYDAGDYTVTYTVSEDDAASCATGEDDTVFTITVNEAPNAGPGGNFTFCESEFTALAAQISANPAGEGIELLNEFDPTITAGGDFTDDTLADLLADYAATTSFPATFSTTYTVSNADCTDSAEYSITINPNEDADAGDDLTGSFCSSEGIVDLTSILADGTTTSGVFSSDDITITDGRNFDTNAEGAGTYKVTYTVNSGTDPCVTGEDTALITVTVNDPIDLGGDASDTICSADISDDFFDEDNLEASFLALLPSGAPQDGTFNPSISELSDDYEGGMTTGDFTTTYTVVQDECEVSVNLTITVRDAVDADLEEVDPADPICQNAGVQNLTNFIGSNPDFGVFDGYEDGTFDPAMMDPGTYTITYTLSEDTSECVNGTDSIDIIITIRESALAGIGSELTVCSNAGAQNLFDFLSPEADTNGEFTYDGDVITDGIMDPSAFAAGEYEITYTVPEINDCGPDTATFTITVEDAPGAPAVAGNPFTFCATEMATVADLAATGTNLTYYSDADLTTMVAAEDALVSGSYYVTQRNDDGACESAATEITVTINDADTPTISNTTQEFCEYDDATIADLTAAVNETGTITWYDSADGDNALNAGTALQDGTVYYATLFNVDTGCESSVRLAVTVDITDCPLLFPEGFSPNGDGINDTFDIENIEDEYPNYTIEIYNRWGDSVYKGNANTPDWDGYSSDSSLGDDVLPVGVYFYYLNFNDGSTEPRRGKVYLSR